MARSKTDYPTLALLVLMYVLWLGNAVVYFVNPLPWPVHVLVGALAIHLAFTIWHEAVHATVSRSQWVNDVVGVVGMFPYMTPYFMQRWVHLEHHRKMNEKEDPNYIYLDGSLLTLPLRYPRALAYGKKLLKTDPRSRGEKVSDLGTTAVIGLLYAGAVLSGHLRELVVLWFAPVVLAKLVMDWYVNYLPHRGLPADRFKGTRIIAVPWFTPLVLNHNYHAIHHIWPTVPWYRYRQIYRKKLEYLKSNGVPIERRVFGSWT